MWNGDYLFVLSNLVKKDFKTRYRNMSLGVFWSMLNPLVLMGVLTLIFTVILPDRATPHFPALVLCGLVPYNFFSLAWISGTRSVVENAHLIKRVAVPREVVPLSTVFGNCVHLGIQIALLLTFVLLSGLGVNVYWLWLPVVWALEIVFVCGLALMFSALDVFIRDIRYVVESCNVVLFWMVPIFYPFSAIPRQYKDFYQYNPVAALVLISRDILLEARPPSPSTLIKLMFSSMLMLTMGWVVFRKLKPRFYDYL